MSGGRWQEIDWQQEEWLQKQILARIIQGKEWSEKRKKVISEAVGAVEQLHTSQTTLPAADDGAEFCAWAAIEAAWRRPLRPAVRICWRR